MVETKVHFIGLQNHILGRLNRILFLISSLLHVFSPNGQEKRQLQKNSTITDKTPVTEVEHINKIGCSLQKKGKFQWKGKLSPLHEGEKKESGKQIKKNVKILF